MLQFITSGIDRYEYSHSSAASILIDNGCKWVQLRMKDATRDELRHEAERLRELTRNKATFIIDDDVAMVGEVDADGVHLGKNDMPVREARAILGPGKIIGATANTFEELSKAVEDGADYIGVGPFRFTNTKKNLAPVLGLDGYRAIMSQCRDAGITIPVVAIGGITAEDIHDLMSTGITGIAVSGALLRTPDPVAELKCMLHEISTSTNIQTKKQ